MPINEAARLEALRRYEVLDTPAEEAFDALTELAAALCKTPIALISLADEARQWFKSRVGLEARETPRKASFCAQAIQQPDLFVVRDVRADERFAASALIMGDPRIRFYAGMPLITPDGHALGTLCVMDCVPRELAPEQAQALRVLAREVVAQLELRRAALGQKRQQESLRESEERYRNFVSQSGEGIWRFELEKPLPLGASEEEALEHAYQHAVLAECNDAMARMYGFCWAEEIIGARLGQLLPRSDARNVAYLKSFLHSGYRLSDVESYEIDKDGNSKIFLNNLVGIAENGSLVRVWGTQRDVTERKRAEEALRESEAKFRALTETAACAIFISQGDKIVYANAASESLVGCGRDELRGRDFWDFIHPEFRELVRQRRQARLRGEAVPERYEFKVVDRSGKERWVDFTATLVEYEGQPAVLGTAFDVTERKALEKRLAMGQKMEAVGRLAGGIAHDFNNLLGVILGYSELITEGLPATNPTRKKVEEIQKAGRRAAALTRQLLAFSRRQILEPRVLSLNGVVAEMESLLRRLIPEHIELVIQLEAGLRPVKADPSQLEQVILNLALNARDAMSKGGKLTIQTAQAELTEASIPEPMALVPGPFAMLAVSDTGKGMDPETLHRVFEPFFTTKELGKGTGLGLATVYGIVKQSGGYIWVKSAEGKGSTFTVYLPQVDQAAEQLPSAVPAKQAVRGSETVLLVEDEESVRQLMREFLEQSGYTVLAASDGPGALEVAARHGDTIHVVVTDVVLPGMSGREVAEKLSESRPQMKVLYVSGYPDEAILYHGVLNPDTAFLQKPFSREALLRKVRATLEQEK